jgi:drug/metabolite transporter (DMT)-like permease
VALAVVAGALITSERDERRPSGARQALVLAVVAGIGFGVSFVLFAESSHHSGFWPVLSARAAAVVGVSIVVVASRVPRSIERAPRRLALGAGVLDVGATTLLLVAVRTGQIALVAPVASLAPGFTVVNAWWYLHEKASRIQLAGLVLALLGLALIAVG